MRLWYLLHRRPAKAQASLRIRAVLPEPLLFTHIKYGSKQRVLPKIRHLTPLDGCTCAFEECIHGRKVPSSHEMAQFSLHMSFVTRKPVFGVCNQGRLKPACSTTEARKRLEFRIKKLEVLYYLSSEQQRCWSDCAEAQADLCLCCSHMAKTGFLMTWLICCRYNICFYGEIWEIIPKLSSNTHLILFFCVLPYSQG